MRRLVRSVKSCVKSTVGLRTVTPRVSWNPCICTFISLFCAQLRRATRENAMAAAVTSTHERDDRTVTQLLELAALHRVVVDHPAKDHRRLGHGVPGEIPIHAAAG